MQIGKNAVVTIDYTLTDKAGTVLDSSEGGEPFAFIQGVGGIISGLERALEGKAKGDQFEVSIAPEDAYGFRDENLIQDVQRSQFEGIDDLAVGMKFQTASEEGMQIVTVTAIEGDTVSVDANHPLAGETLNFDVSIVDVREATPEELDHGHVHGPGDHHH